MLPKHVTDDSNLCARKCKFGIFEITSFGGIHTVFQIKTQRCEIHLKDDDPHLDVGCGRILHVGFEA